MLVIQGIRVSAQIDQQPGDCKPVLGDSEQQWRTSPRVPSLKISSSPNGQRGCGCVTALGGSQQAPVGPLLRRLVRLQRRTQHLC